MQWSFLLNTVYASMAKSYYHYDLLVTRGLTGTWMCSFADEARIVRVPGTRTKYQHHMLDQRFRRIGFITRSPRNLGGRSFPYQQCACSTLEASRGTQCTHDVNHGSSFFLNRVDTFMNTTRRNRCTLKLVACCCRVGSEWERHPGIGTRCLESISDGAKSNSRGRIFLFSLWSIIN